jgi:hypothetical protein
MMDSWYFCQASSAILQMHRFHSSFVVFSFVLEMLSLCLLILRSLKYVGLDFHSPVFTHGQFYVAISRATSVNRIKAMWDPKFPNPVTKNHVFPEVLLL